MPSHPHRPSSPTIHRRSFLKTSGVLAGAALLPRWSESFNRPTRPALAGSLSLGVLSPTSSAYPNLSNNFLAGLQTYWASTRGSRPSLSARTYTNFGELRQLAQGFLATGVSGVIVLTSPTRASYLQDVFSASGVPLFVSTVGANTIHAGDVTGAALTSLEHWQAGLGLGSWAARNLGRRAFVAASVHDGGYDALYAFQSGYEGAGGTVMETALSHRPTNNGDLSGLMAAIQNANPSLVYAAYCGPQAIEFVRAYVASGLSAHIPLAGTSFMGDEALLTAYGVSLPRLYSGLTTFNLINGLPAEPFTALGYHTGRQVANHFKIAAEKTPALATYVRVHTLQTRTGRSSLLTTTLPEKTLVSVKEALSAEIQTGWLTEYGCV